MRDELLMEIRVTCHEPVSVEGATRKIVMIPFTGEASGPYFNGRVTARETPAAFLWRTRETGQSALRRPS